VDPTIFSRLWLSRVNLTTHHIKRLVIINHIFFYLGQPSIVDSAHESCFKNKSVTTLVTFLVIFVVCLAVASAILTYFILKLRKKLFGLQKSENPTSGGAPSSTAMTKS